MINQCKGCKISNYVFPSEQKKCTKCHFKPLIYCISYRAFGVFLVLSDSLSVVPRTAVIDSRVHDNILFLFIDDDNFLYKM